MLYHVYATPSGGDNEILAGVDFLTFDQAYVHALDVMAHGIPLRDGGTARANHVCVIDDTMHTLHELHDEAE